MGERPRFLLPLSPLSLLARRSTTTIDVALTELWVLSLLLLLLASVVVLSLLLWLSLVLLNVAVRAERDTKDTFFFRGLVVVAVVGSGGGGVWIL